MLCEPQGFDRYGRMLACCTAGGEDVGLLLVRRGLTHAYRQQWPYGAAEGHPRCPVGLWRDGDQIPSRD